MLTMPVNAGSDSATACCTRSVMSTRTSREGVETLISIKALPPPRLQPAQRTVDREVEVRGLEPLASAMRTRRSPN